MKFLGKVTKLPNETCPLTGKSKVAKKGSVVIAFCCGNCKKKFDAAPQKFLAKVKAKPKKKTE